MELKLVPETAQVLRHPCQEFNFADPPFDPVEFSVKLAEAMVRYDGLGLSANQVGYPYRIFVMKSDAGGLALFNPKVVDVSEEVQLGKEGCLSYPLLYLAVKRPIGCRIRYQTPEGMVTTDTFNHLAARVALHEYDHLEGKLFTDACSDFEFKRASRKRSILTRKVKRANVKYLRNPKDGKPVPYVDESFWEEK